MNLQCVDSLDHSRTIVHIDIDCFYAQVEMNKNPSLKSVPLGIQQKNFIITSNYVAREFGIKKCMLLTDAKRLCPELVIVNGEDLHDYRQVSQKITSLLHSFSPFVERLGLDENFIDVTGLVSERLKCHVDPKFVGHIFGDVSDMCDCGCTERIKMGCIIAQDIRNKIITGLGFTTCAGIAHNKLLAKLVCSKHKPNQQTLILPNNAFDFMRAINLVREIPGIGQSGNKALGSFGIKTVEDLQNADLSQLANEIGHNKAKMYSELSYGLDSTPVKPTGKPQNIGIEDSNRGIYSQHEVREKLKELLNRLMILVAEDGRIPKCIKLTIRIVDKKNKIQSRKSKQTTIATSLFNVNNLCQLSESNENQILSILIAMFKKIIDVSKPFHFTLVGVSFSKFIECCSGRTSTLQTFLYKSLDNSERQISNVKNTVTNFHDTSRADVEPQHCSKKIKLERTINKNPDSVETNFVKNEATSNSEEVKCPPNICKEVFKELPFDIQKELWVNFKHLPKTLPKNHSKKAKPNSILNYLTKQ